MSAVALPAGPQDMRSRLADGVRVVGLELSDAQIDQLLAYQSLIEKWNKVYNLTALRDPAEMLTHHLLDSLAVVPALQRHLRSLAVVDMAGVGLHKGVDGKGGGPAEGTALGLGGGASGGHSVGTERGPDGGAGSLTDPVRLLDVGSGAGLPGVVFAICIPGLVVHCVDTVGKKAAFIQQVAASLRLPNLRGIHARVESLTDRYAVVSSRAFASLQDFTQWSFQALDASGVWMAMKGKHPEDELAALPAGVEVFHVEPVSVPGLDADRCIVWMRKHPKS